MSLVEETHAIPACRNIKNETAQNPLRIHNQSAQQRFSLGNKGESGFPFSKNGLELSSPDPLVIFFKLQYCCLESFACDRKRTLFEGP